MTKVVEQEFVSSVFGSDTQFATAPTKGHRLYAAIETLIKGPELSLTDHGELPYLNEDGHQREQARVRRLRTGSTLNVRRNAVL